MSAPYPLLLEPVILEKVWGGRRLAALGKSLAKPDARYGESWELADMGSTSASGAGGGAVRSKVVNGAMAGKTIGEAWGAWGDRLLQRSLRGSGVGAVSSGSESRTTFPLLIKFLDASENLSVQVHPSLAYAAAHAGANLKTECWYILEADAGAVIYKGIKPGVTRAAFEKLSRANDPQIVDAMIAVPAVAGQMHNLPSGTVHALGAGVVVAEVQTPSDTTFRLYDWGRQGRALHVEESLACASFEGEAGHAELLSGLTVASLQEPEMCRRLVETEFFTVDEVRPLDGDGVTIGFSCKGRGGCFVLVVIGGSGELTARDGSQFEPVPLRKGSTVLVPGSIGSAAMLKAERGMRVLRVGI